jgi:PAS domain S-box-containing protein
LIDAVLLNIALAGQIAVVALALWLVRVTGVRLTWTLFAAGSICLLARASLLVLYSDSWALETMGMITQATLFSLGLTLLALAWITLVPVLRKWHAERQRRTIELNQLQMVTNSLPLLLIFVDEHERVKFINGIAQMWFGLGAEAARDRPLEKVIGPTFYAAMQSQVQYALTGEQSVYENVPIDDGDLRHYSICYIPERDADNKVDGLHIIVEDVTDQLRALEKLRQTEIKMAELQTIRKTAATYEHEIFNPLAGIMGLVQLMQEEENMPEGDRAEMIAQVYEAAQRIQKVTARIAELESPEFRAYPTGNIEILKL